MDANSTNHKTKRLDALFSSLNAIQSQALRHILKTDSKADRVYQLKDLAKKVPVAYSNDIYEEAIESIAAIPDLRRRREATTSLAGELPESLILVLLEELKKEDDVNNRASLIQAILRFLPADSLMTLLEYVLTIESSEVRDSLLGSLVLWIAERGRLEQSLAAVGEISDANIRDHATAQLMRYVPSSVVDKTPSVSTDRKGNDPMVKEVFISHSSGDEDIARALIELLRAAIPTLHDKIRCTSIDGYRLEGGSYTDEKLKAEIKEAKFFIGLITPLSMSSAYVLFELGARWGADLHLAPVLAAGADSSLLRGPLSSLSALNCSTGGQMQQLIEEIAKSLNYPLGNAPTYYPYIEKLALCSKEAGPSKNP